MPHKRNPVLSILIRRAAIAAPQLAATLHTAAALANDERPDGAWHAEWDTLRTLARRTVVAGSQCGELLAGLQVHAARMAQNLSAADVLGEQHAIADLVGKAPSATYVGAVDRLIEQSLDRARRILSGLIGIITSVVADTISSRSTSYTCSGSSLPLTCMRGSSRTAKALPVAS